MSAARHANTAKAAAGRGARVRIAYRPFHHARPRWVPTDLQRGYAYTWDLPGDPQVGDRVVLEQYSGRRAVIVGFDTEYRGELGRVYRRATARELKVADEKFAANEATWLALVRSAAGLSAGPVAPRSIPGFPRVSTIAELTSEQGAYEAVQMWRLALEYATRQQWPESDKRAIDEILTGCLVAKARGHWY